MFDSLRNLTKSAEEKRQEAISAYLDGALTPAERRPFEQQLARDPRLQAEVEQQRLLQQTLRQLPRRPVPRNFTLDPARYGRPQPQPLLQLYPVLRVATALTAVFFVIAIVLDVLTPAAGVPSFSVASEAVSEAVEDTGVVSEVIVEEGEAVEETGIVAPEAMAVEEEATAAAEPEGEVAAEPAEEPAAEEPVSEVEIVASEEEEATVAALERTIEAPAPLATVPESLPFGASPMATAVPDFADTANGVPEQADEGPAVAADEAAAEATRETDVGVTRTEPLSPFRQLQIGLGVALVLLVLITYLARRQL